MNAGSTWNIKPVNSLIDVRILFALTIGRFYDVIPVSTQLNGAEHMLCGSAAHIRGCRHNVDEFASSLELSCPSLPHGNACYFINRNKIMIKKGKVFYGQEPPS